MLSKEDLSRIIKDEVENLVKKGEEPYKFYYILLNGEMYPQDKYDKEVAEGKRSSNDIYAYVDEWHTPDFDAFLFYANYIFSVEHIIEAYLRKAGFTIEYSVVQPPTPNLKYYIDVNIKVKGTGTEPQYLGVSIYDIDSIARALHIPQIVQQKLGNKPGKITEDDVDDIRSIVTKKQLILAGYTYYDAWYILSAYSVFHDKKYKGEANKLAFAYSQLFPTPYRVCYEWKAGAFDKIDCLKLELRRFSS